MVHPDKNFRPEVGVAFRKFHKAYELSAGATPMVTAG